MESYGLVIGGFGIMHSSGERHTILYDDVTVQFGGSGLEKVLVVEDEFRGRGIIAQSSSASAATHECHKVPEQPN